MSPKTKSVSAPEKAMHVVVYTVNRPINVNRQTDEQLGTFNTRTLMLYNDWGCFLMVSNLFFYSIKRMQREGCNLNICFGHEND